MYNIIFYIIFLILLFYFFYKFPLILNEHLTTKDIEATKSDKCGCDEIKSLNNLISQYNILNSKIENNTKEINSIKNNVSNIKTVADKNQTSILKIENLIKQLQAAAKEKS